MMQRAHLTAQLLGVADRNHERMFRGIWETGDFPFFDMTTGRPRATAPVIRDAARFYARGGGVTEEDFVKKAASPEVQAAIERTEKLIMGWQVGGTPTFVVAGRYRVDSSSVATVGELQSLINFLVGQERNRRQAGATATKK
jgi:thiol:disulfide interchange protein DsbA